jgi:lysozyme family protein
MTIEEQIAAVIERAGGYVENDASDGGVCKYGITEAVARAHGFTGPMSKLGKRDAEAIYLRLYWTRPRLNEVAKIAPRVASELFDTGINMGPAVAVTFLQRALTALNRNGKDYPDLVPDGRIGAATLAALGHFFAIRGQSSGETILCRALEALQGERYLRLAERRPANEAFLYGWLANRIGEGSR